MWKVVTTATAASSAPSSKDGVPSGATGGLPEDSQEHQAHTLLPGSGPGGCSATLRGKGLWDGSSSA